jgi:hypothetical protein
MPETEFEKVAFHREFPLDIILDGTNSDTLILKKSANEKYWITTIRNKCCVTVPTYSMTYHQLRRWKKKMLKSASRYNYHGQCIEVHRGNRIGLAILNCENRENIL